MHLYRMSMGQAQKNASAEKPGELDQVFKVNQLINVQEALPAATEKPTTSNVYKLGRDPRPGITQSMI